jgi:LPXTG-motif cell wall-anchored protein
MRKLARILATTLLLGTGSTVSAVGVSAGDCDSLLAQEQLLARHPEASAACESIVSVEGRRYLLMSAELRLIQEQQLVLRFRGAGEDLVLSAGSAAPFGGGPAEALPTDTPVGSPLRVYVPEDRVLEVLGSATNADRPPVPVAIERVESRADRDARIANYTCCPRRRPWYPIIDVLPQTATPLPLVGVLGLGLLVLAAGLGHRRRARR